MQAAEQEQAIEQAAEQQQAIEQAAEQTASEAEMFRAVAEGTGTRLVVALGAPRATTDQAHAPAAAAVHRA